MKRAGATGGEMQSREAALSDRGRPDPVAGLFGAFERRLYEGEARSPKTANAAALDHLAARLDEKPYAGLSLAVFDTLLLRNAKGDSRRLWEIAERWRDEAVAAAGPIEVQDLYLARLRAAQLAASAGPLIGARAPRLDALVDLSLSLLGLPPELAPRFMAIELEYEVENLAPNPLIQSVLERYAHRGGRVMLLSDSHFAGAQLRWILARLGLEGVTSHIYSRADTATSKRSGRVFGAVAQKHQLAPGDILHLGDSFEADFAMPRSAGWAAQHLPVPLCEEHMRAQDEREFLDGLVGARP